MTRRFIAGARCPECQALDRIQRVDEDGQLSMLCVACGMRRDLDDPADASPPKAGQPVRWRATDEAE